MEEDMDVLIVKRGRRFEGFTPEGERVLAWAQQMMEDCMRLKQELHELRDHGVQGPFRIGRFRLVPKVGSELAMSSHHFRWRMNLLAVACGERGDLGRFFPGAPSALQILANLLAARAG